MRCSAPLPLRSLCVRTSSELATVENVTISFESGRRISYHVVLAPFIASLLIRFVASIQLSTAIEAKHKVMVVPCLLLCLTVLGGKLCAMSAGGGKWEVEDRVNATRSIAYFLVNNDCCKRYASLFDSLFLASLQLNCPSQLLDTASQSPAVSPRSPNRLLRAERLLRYGRCWVVLAEFLRSFGQEQKTSTEWCC